MVGYAIVRFNLTQPLLFLLVSSTDHITGMTGLTPIVTLSKNGAAFAAPAGAVQELGNGWYRVAANTGDTDTYGPLLLHATATGADPTDVMFAVVAYNPLEGIRLGLTAFPGTVSGAAGGLPLLDANQRLPADLQTIQGQAVSATTSVNFGSFVGQQFRLWSDNQGNVMALAVQYPVVASSVTGDVGGSVGSVVNPVVASSVTGSVGSVTGSVGSVVGNVGGDVQGNVVGHVLGNVSGSVGGLANPSGIILDPTGLDQIAITQTNGPAATFPQMVIQTWRRFYKRTLKDQAALRISTFADDNVTVLTTQYYTDDGLGNENLGPAQ